LTDGGTPDAGSSDAGTPDAGGSDAGTSDGGTPDAGVSDAGVDAIPDGGLGGKPKTAEGCGCQSGDAGPGPTLPLFAMVGLFWLRRRRVRA
jgi:MYXO-CTERM domain-containing protein